MNMALKRWHKVVLALVLLITIVGITDSGYLSIHESTGTAVTCSLTGGCNDVLESPYARMFGIPLAYLGLAFYCGMFVITALALRNRHWLWLKLLSLGGLTGFLMSLYFVYIQFFEIGSICQYCMLSAISSTLLCLLTTPVFFTARHQHEDIRI